MATSGGKRCRKEELLKCQRRLEYLSSRLQDLAIEIGDGKGAVWLQENMWYVHKLKIYLLPVYFLRTRYKLKLLQLQIIE